MLPSQVLDVLALNLPPEKVFVPVVSNAVSPTDLFAACHAPS